MATNANWQGMNWIAKDKRFALYMRDGMTCAYCNRSVVDGEDVVLSLDHLTPRSQGGNNHESNLITCCKNCNSSRGDAPVESFVESIDVLNYIAKQTQRDIAEYRKLAKEILSNARGSFFETVVEVTALILN